MKRRKKFIFFYKSKAIVEKYDVKLLRENWFITYQSKTRVFSIQYENTIVKYSEPSSKYPYKSREEYDNRAACDNTIKSLSSNGNKLTIR